jgi:quercetin dioxygenase-like cupin family protein
MILTRTAVGAFLVLAIAGHVSDVWAQQPGVTRVELLRHDSSLPGREVVQVRVELAPGTVFPEHTHPGDEIAYVLEGSLEYQIDNGARSRSGRVKFCSSRRARSTRPEA